MSVVFDIIIGILVFSVLVLIHEFGHFMMAKRGGIKVEEFGLGLPPRIWGKKKGETIYSINAIPFGGFVRMLGEDALDPKMRKKKRSFAAAPISTRIKVVVAGVVMNFFLAWVLLTGLLTYGIDPLLTQDDILPAVENGILTIEKGLQIENVEPQSLAQELGLLPDDVVVKVNKNDIDLNSQTSLLTDEIRFESISYVREGEELFVMVNELKEDFIVVEDLGVSFYGGTVFPGLKIFGLEASSPMFEAGLNPDDLIVSVDDKKIFSMDDLNSAVLGKETVELEFMRNYKLGNVFVDIDSQELNFPKGALITSVLVDSPAEKAGLMERDLIVMVNNFEISSVEHLQTVLADFKDDEEIHVFAMRNNIPMDFYLSLEDGLMNVYLSDVYNTAEFGQVLFYEDLDFYSIVDMQKQKYPIYKAWYMSFVEGARLSSQTFTAFFSTVKTIFSTGEVPEGVSGPVGIFKMSSLAARDGIVSLLTFVALISLALGVMNILPIPALDGGRLVFILIELVRGKPINQKWETYIHVFFYLLLIGLILFISYFDVLRLFN